MSLKLGVETVNNQDVGTRSVIFLDLDKGILSLLLWMECSKDTIDLSSFHGFVKILVLPYMFGFDDINNGKNFHT